jgi:hypothetical protein
MESGAGLAWLEGEELAGYGVIRPCRQGHKIGPLFASSPEIAEALFNGLVSPVPSEERVYLNRTA